jgi:hypothetical protein
MSDHIEGLDLVPAHMRGSIVMWIERGEPEAVSLEEKKHGRALIANAKAFQWCNLATQWDDRARDLAALYHDLEGAKDAHAIAEAIRAAALRLVERTR